MEIICPKCFDALLIKDPNFVGFNIYCQKCNYKPKAKGLHELLTEIYTESLKNTFQGKKQQEAILKLKKEIEALMLLGLTK